MLKKRVFEPLADLKRECLFLYSNFFWERFDNHKNCLKIDFPLYFQKVILVWGDSFFARQISLKNQTRQNMPKF